MTEENKKYIEENFQILSVKEIAANLKLSIKKVATIVDLLKKHSGINKFDTKSNVISMTAEASVEADKATNRRKGLRDNVHIIKPVN